MSRTLIVVPCFDEADRLPADRFAAFVETEPDVSFVLVNDGSRDATLARLRELERTAPSRFSVLDLPENRGKGEAVRAGMLHAFARGPELAGYWDADLATPLEEIPRFVELLERRPERLVVFGARVALLGRSIRRRAWRHYLGRVFATVAAETLHVPVYDTQCGAKLFRVGPETRALFGEPFLSRWIFDVEILARLVAASGKEGAAHAREVVYELAVRQWHDVGDSKVGASGFARSLVDMARIWRRYLR